MSQAAAELTMQLTLPPHHYDGNIYYVEIKWDSFVVANSTWFQFALGTYTWEIVGIQLMTGVIKT